MKIIDGKEQEYKEWYDINLDPYGHACFTYAERWAEMLEEIIDHSSDNPARVIIDNASAKHSEVHYEGTVWCVNLRKNGVFLLRRNGKEFISGNCATEFVNHALEISDDGTKVAMFLKIQFLETKKRYELFKQYPPKKIYVFVNRVNCGKNGVFGKESSAVCYCWFVWEKGYKGKPTVDWIT